MIHNFTKNKATDAGSDGDADEPDERQDAGQHRQVALDEDDGEGARAEQGEGGHQAEAASLRPHHCFSRLASVASKSDSKLRIFFLRLRMLTPTSENERR